VARGSAGEGAEEKQNRPVLTLGETPMKRFIAAAAFAVAQWQPVHAQVILGSIPEEFRGDWCWHENTSGDQIFRPGACKSKTGSLSIDRMTLDTGRLFCGFDSGTASDGTLKMRMLCTDPEEKHSSVYGAQLTLLPGKKIELLIEPNGSTVIETR
jgi:hypothetical protein